MPDNKKYESDKKLIDPTVTNSYKNPNYTLIKQIELKKGNIEEREITSSGDSDV